jgi:RNA polymerase sigma-70 factor, ECF subfamily
LSRYACTLPGVSRQDAEDLVQVTFYSALMNWERGLCSLDQESLRRWLYRVLHRRAIDEWRTYGARHMPSDRMEVLPNPCQDTYLSAVWSIVLEHCWERIARMPEARQRVAFLRWRMDWTPAEIADWLGISPSTVRVHLMEARDALTEDIGPEFPLDGSDDDSGEGGER